MRTARPGDLYRIAELESQLFGHLGFSHSALLQLYGTSGEAWLVAEDLEGVWGYALTTRAMDDPRVGWILALGVHSERRGEHIGRALLDESIVELRSRDMDTIKLTVEPGNLAAYALYIQAGFQDTGQIKEGDIGDGMPRKILTLLLPTVLAASQPEEPADEQHEEQVPEDIAGISLDFQDRFPRA
ncbi:GCN5-related N-acetyltransferase [Catenulispora acidiphila DSM 44928]|uniref:GCN5-related N-acetyltransferase n=1 Tax=Catenulispora acidiphila (strain DSM 44928 / JCM 14897 / NBRC 102108 / NRRL B-24433 / ID139908) TaxID=479433 RepID=C7Q1B9_CATAD|nr:GNAT family N-acetyltransferase [Catenulispora acidiphila]ACU73648.1 GCN5-related N-acetyltransferase [Catenulispora acidiphila DSM 44928]